MEGSWRKDNLRLLAASLKKFRLPARRKIKNKPAFWLGLKNLKLATLKIQGCLQVKAKNKSQHYFYTPSSVGQILNLGRSQGEIQREIRKGKLGINYQATYKIWQPLQEGTLIKVKPQALTGRGEFLIRYLGALKKIKARIPLNKGGWPGGLRFVLKNWARIPRFNYKGKQQTYRQSALIF